MFLFSLPPFCLCYSLAFIVFVLNCFCKLLYSIYSTKLIMFYVYIQVNLLNYFSCPLGFPGNKQKKRVQMGTVSIIV